MKMKNTWFCLFFIVFTGVCGIPIESQNKKSKQLADQYKKRQLDESLKRKAHPLVQKGHQAQIFKRWPLKLETEIALQTDGASEKRTNSDVDLRYNPCLFLIREEKRQCIEKLTAFPTDFKTSRDNTKIKVDYQNLAAANTAGAEDHIAKLVNQQMSEGKQQQGHVFTNNSMAGTSENNSNGFKPVNKEINSAEIQKIILSNIKNDQRVDQLAKQRKTKSRQEKMAGIIGQKLNSNLKFQENLETGRQVQKPRVEKDNPVEPNNFDALPEETDNGISKSYNNEKPKFYSKIERAGDTDKQRYMMGNSNIGDDVTQRPNTLVDSQIESEENYFKKPLAEYPLKTKNNYFNNYEEQNKDPTQQIIKSLPPKETKNSDLPSASLKPNKFTTITITTVNNDKQLGLNREKSKDPEQRSKSPQEEKVKKEPLVLTSRLPGQQQDDGADDKVTKAAPAIEAESEPVVRIEKDTEETLDYKSFFELWLKDLSVKETLVKHMKEMDENFSQILDKIEINLESIKKKVDYGFSTMINKQQNSKTRQIDQSELTKYNQNSPP